MLILPNGYRTWQNKIKLCAPDPEKPRKLRSETGYPVTQQMDGRDGLRGERLRWWLPPNFCPDCECRDITSQRGPDGSERLTMGVWVLEANYPHIDASKGDLICHYKCFTCMDRDLWCRNALGTISRWEYDRKVKERMEKNIVEYIKVERLRGKEHPLLGDDTRLDAAKEA